MTEGRLEPGLFWRVPTGEFRRVAPILGRQISWGAIRQMLLPGGMHDQVEASLKEDEQDGPVARPLATAGLADALESGRFKQFLDHVPVAVAVAELVPPEVITYVNLEFEALTGKSAAEIEGKSWAALPGVASVEGDDTRLGDAVRNDDEYVGAFTVALAEGSIELDAWSNTIEDDAGTASFRLVALARVGSRRREADEQLSQVLRERDTQLLELQHRVKNNLQMITALIRMEARNASDARTQAQLDRLQGRINALSHLYALLSAEGVSDTVDLGVYVSQIASSVMQAHPAEGVRLEMKVDSWPVSINVAMPTGLVVNELLTNALKHAFVGRKGGTISLTSLVDDNGCRVTVADDGVGLPEGTTWPQSGRLGALIAQSLRQNAGARFDVLSVPGEGMCVEIFFARAAAVA
jgi:two-component sensor histidine kinase